MKLHEEFKLYEDLWEDSPIKEELDPDKPVGYVIAGKINPTRNDKVFIAVAPVRVVDYASADKFSTLRDARISAYSIFKYIKGDTAFIIDLGTMNCVERIVVRPDGTIEHDFCQPGVENLEEAYTHYSFDFETEVDYYGAIYCARELTYSLVYDPKTAARLYNYAVKNDWDEEEIPALGDLIGDALEGANYHQDIDDYARSVDPFPYWKSTNVSSSDKAKIDALLAKYKATTDRRWLLWEAINAALYRY
jgi:hypothetical protein